MAKMNSRGASPSRLVPPGNCNQNANPPSIPDKMVSTPKSILYNEIPDEREPLRSPPFRSLERKTAQVCFFCLTSFAQMLGHRAGIFLLRPEILPLAVLKPAVLRSGCGRNGTEKNAPYPQVE